jgi:hypothetical protein
VIDWTPLPPVLSEAEIATVTVAAFVHVPAVYAAPPVTVAVAADVGRVVSVMWKWPQASPPFATHGVLPMDVALSALCVPEWKSSNAHPAGTVTLVTLTDPGLPPMLPGPMPVTVSVELVPAAPLQFAVEKVVYATVHVGGVGVTAWKPTFASVNEVVAVPLRGPVATTL